MILLDLFSGTGGFHKGLSDAGFDFKEVYFSEIDKHAIANYKYNYPNAEHIGSVENIIQSGINRPDIITFGSPCQDFSVAGNRKGLTGDKSSLIRHAITAITHFRPDIFIWENVKGAFSSNARQDFWAIIQAFANIGGYDIEWQLVNTSWLLPQNRERIYLVGHLTTTVRNWGRVFPIGERCKIRHKPNEVKEKIYEDTLTITAKSQMNWTGSFIQVAGRTGKGMSGIVLNDRGISRCLTYGHGDVPKIIQSNPKSKVLQINPSRESGKNQPYQQNRMYNTDGLSPALNTDTRSPIVSPKEMFISDPVHFHKEQRIYKENAPTIQASYGTGGDNIPYVNNVRRLTEIECERLQGFPDDWTKYGNYNEVIKPLPKTQRYKLLGNAVTATMVQLIGSKLLPDCRQADACSVALYGFDGNKNKMAA